MSEKYYGIYIAYTAIAVEYRYVYIIIIIYIYVYTYVTGFTKIRRT